MIFDVRLFTGLSLPPEMLASMEELLAELEPLARIQWSRVSQLHITTKFIEKWPFPRVPELCRFLGAIPPSERFTVTVTGLGYFATPNRTWSLYARVEPCEGLLRLATSVNDALAQLKIPREQNEFRPHITIGKIGQNPWPLLDERVQEYNQKPFGSFEATEYHLYESAPGGYRICCTIPLSEASSTL